MGAGWTLSLNTAITEESWWTCHLCFQRIIGCLTLDPSKQECQHYLKECWNWSLSIELTLYNSKKNIIPSTIGKELFSPASWTSSIYIALWRAYNLSAFNTVPLVQCFTRLLPIMRDLASIPGGYLCETGILLLALSRYIGDPEVIDHCGLVWGGLRPEPQ